MEKLTKFTKTIRNNWKKSLVAAYAICYGANKAKEKYEINIIMRAACKEAAKYGDSLIEINRNPTIVTVVLNPVANKRKAKKDYENYCEPLLHLAGLQVDVVQTSAEGDAKDIVENLKGTEAIIVAGGDGTLSETVTGLLRRNDEANRFPVGVLPLGRTNTFSNKLFPGGEGVDKVKQLVEASMAIVKGQTVQKDVMKVEPVQEDNAASRPIYALSSIDWGAFRDANSKRDKYWFVGSLRNYAAYLFNGYKDSLTWDCSGTLKYTPPCSGCTNCVTQKKEYQSKWSFFIATSAAQPEKPLKNNPDCSNLQEITFRTCDFKIRTPNVTNKCNQDGLKVIIGKDTFSYTDFVSEGWTRVKGDSRVPKDAISVRTVELIPNINGEVLCEIDNEEYDVKPMKITLMPKVLKVFCST